MKWLYSILPVILAGEDCDRTDKHCLCYDDINECYWTGSPWTGTWQRPFTAYPQPPSEIAPQFFLFRQNDNSHAYRLDINSPTPKELDFSKDTIFLVHGFRDNDVSWEFPAKDEILRYNDMNVIAVDWRKGANVGIVDLYYPTVVQNTRVIGDMTGQLILKFISEGMKDEKVWCAGHSLGAHVCGYIGKHVQKHGSKLARITGIDPAGPYFRDIEPTNAFLRLNSTDATFVDNIHTDGGEYGIFETIGDIDFFPDGGNDQEACWWGNDMGGCSHSMAHVYFQQSVNTCGYQGFKCDSEDDWEDGLCNDCGENGEKCAVMGFHAKKRDVDKNGSRYYLKMQEESPYCGIRHFGNMIAQRKKFNGHW